MSHATHILSKSSFIVGWLGTVAYRHWGKGSLPQTWHKEVNSSYLSDTAALWMQCACMI